jgi:Flp pilus assembly protein TadD
MGLHILISCRNQKIDEHLGSILSQKRYQLFSEIDIGQATVLVQNHKINLVILDNLELLESISKDSSNHHLPIILLNEHKHKSSILNAAKRMYNLIAVVETDIDLDDISGTIINLIEQHDLEEDESIETTNEQEPNHSIDDDTLQEKQEVEENISNLESDTSKKSLSKTPFAELMGDLYQKRATGCLFIQQDQWKKLVYLKSGYPVLVKSNRLDECLGRLLVSSGKITEKECEISLQKMKSSKSKQGTILVRMGSISPQELKTALEQQLMTKFYDIFGWQKGDYQFRHDIQPPSINISLDLSAANAIYQGIKQNLNLAQIKKLLAGDLDKYPAPNSDPRMRFQSLSIDDDEWEILDSLKGDKRLSQILELYEDNEQAIQLIYALKCAKVFIFSKLPTKPKKSTLKTGVTSTGTLTTQTFKDNIDDDENADDDTTINVELGKLRKKMTEELSKKRALNYFELLNLSQNATQAQIDQAFNEIAAKYHPDQTTNINSVQVKKLSNEMFNMACEAHQTLSDNEQKNAYIAKINLKKVPAKQAHSNNEYNQIESADDDLTDNVLNAESMFKKAKEAIKMQRYDEAKTMLESAVGLCPDEGEYRSLLGLALFKSDPDNTTVQLEAREQLSQAISLSPKLDKAYVYLGYVYRHMGQSILSHHEFMKALACNPKCQEALDALNLEKSKNKKKKKGFPHFFGKRKE